MQNSGISGCIPVSADFTVYEDNQTVEFDAAVGADFSACEGADTLVTVSVAQEVVLHNEGVEVEVSHAGYQFEVDVLDTPQGHPPSPGTHTLYLDAAEAVKAGQPIYLLEGEAAPAQNDAYPQAGVVGIALGQAPAGSEVGFTSDGLVTLSDWSFAAGTTRLEAGAEYFLGAAPGTITTIPPSTGVAVRVGRAVYDTTLDVEIGTPIQLL